VQREEESGKASGRHGHPVKLRGEVFTCLIEHCQANPCVSSSTVQRLLQERFGVSVSVSQRESSQGKAGIDSPDCTARKKSPKAMRIEPGYHEQAGGLLLLAAATETGLLPQLEQALPTALDPACPPLASSSVVRRHLLLTVLFLSAVGLQRTWDLRGYTADGLALLTGRTRAYGYRHTEAFLSQVICADGAERFTNALACWATQLWHLTENTGEAEQPHTLTCYVDGHRKPVYSEMLLPRGLIGRLGVILGCRALLLLHDELGHPLFVTTLSFDQHLTVGVPAFLERYEQHAGNSQVTQMIVDREGMATDFLARLHAEGRHVVTILQTNQDRDLSSFSDVGAFVPLSRDIHGQVIREVAPARISLPREDHPDDPLRLQVALIRDLRRTVPVRPDPEEAPYPSRWDSDLPNDQRTGGVKAGKRPPLRPKRRQRN
jgi:hypothetical protein